MGSLLEDLAGLTGTVGVAGREVAGADIGAAATGAAGGRGEVRRAMRPLGAQPLRYALSLELLRAGELTVRQLIAHLDAAGYRVAGRASKVISDALRWEVGHGRVVRVRRGVYRIGVIPRSTIRWMRDRLAAWEAVAVAPAVSQAQPVVETRDQGVRTGRPAHGRTRVPSTVTRYRRQMRSRPVRHPGALAPPRWVVALLATPPGGR